MAYNLMDEDIDLVPNSPESERSYPTMEEEALKLADYLLTDKCMRSSKVVSRQLVSDMQREEELSSAGSDSDEVIPTANLLHLSPACVAKRAHRRTIVTQELQDMFGFEATPLTGKRKAVRKRPQGADTADFSTKQVPPTVNMPPVCELVSTNPNTDQPVAGSSSTSNQSKSVNHQWKSTSSRNATLDTTSRGSRATGRVTRRSTLLAEQGSNDPITSKIDTGRRGTNVKSQQSADRPVQGTALVKKSVQSKIDTGRGMATPAKASVGFLTPASKRSQTTTRRPSTTPKFITPKIDTGRNRRSNIKSASVAMTTPDPPIGVPSTPARLSMYRNVKSKIDTGHTPQRNIPSSVTKLSNMSSSQTPANKQQARCGRSKHAPSTSVQDRALANKSLNGRTNSANGTSSELFKKPQSVDIKAGRRSVAASVSNRENAACMTTRRRSARVQQS